MSKVLVNETSLSGIANSIRAKNGTTDTYKPSEMPAAIDAIQTGGTVEALDITANGTYTAPEGVDGYSPITVNVPQDGSPPESAFVISGDCSYRFTSGGWDWFIEQYGNKITTSNISNTRFIFYFSNLKTIPFEININDSCFYIQNMFESAKYLRYLPTINIPENPRWNQVPYSDCRYMFRYCYSLRKITEENKRFVQSLYRSNSLHIDQMFSGCYALDEINDFTVGSDFVIISNDFLSVFDLCFHLKNMTFMTDNGTPYVRSWKSQTIDLSNYVGYGSTSRSFCDYNSGISSSKQVKDDATYQALKDDPDWFTTNVAYSRYNHDSAVATINSLPDTSAYLATAGGTNTIKFKGDAGSATDGGAINTLTEEEIAVAAAKGWTVTLV